MPGIGVGGVEGGPCGGERDFCNTFNNEYFLEILKKTSTTLGDTLHFATLPRVVHVVIQ